jgi:myxalamid-type nonribosomal peptide synthetase MxaA
MIDHVGIHDDFFELGGHSLLATKLVDRLRLAFQVELTMIELFESPTVAGLAEQIESPTLQAKVNLDDEVILDPAIAAPESDNSQWQSDPACIFLTGATGFLGAFLLAELVQQTQAKIYCLVRQPDLGKQSLKENLKSYLLWDEAFSDRIIPVVGDLSQPFLGLPQETFQTLANQIDLIYHSAAFVNLLYPYSILKPSNVLGTQEILRLASQTKLKPVHFISTLSIVHSLDYADVETVTEADGLDRWQGLYNGYTQSKWVAEKLVEIARSRGIPISVYRPGVITGSSKTGACNTKDFLNTLLKGLIQIGSAPNLDALWDFTPVDYVSKAVVHLSKQSEAIGTVFHVLNPQPLHLTKLIDLITSFGYPIQTVDYDQWRASLTNFVKCSEEKTLESLLPIFPERFSEKQLKLLTLRFDCQNTLKGLNDTSIVCPPVDRTLLNTYFSYLNHKNFLSA